MVELLLQKKKIVESREGFILPVSWLEEIKNQLAEKRNMVREN